eukprot:CAMPEP_0202732070 /NCGR_PEP_ID=MMETSP1385-20130828/187468_1 /ASSEMBLY_ACC=CAM_ASM_000861 /TAXON_ID=933848 /ORGANISM="Elphidium margaritaceum" /LENGTH=428 /DNA_ID=CAMNT_0049398373 /DNA_START=584 /DNA_END=1870 /DNA_ORIENTATION=+
MTTSMEHVYRSLRRADVDATKQQIRHHLTVYFIQMLISLAFLVTVSLCICLPTLIFFEAELLLSNLCLVSLFRQKLTLWKKVCVKCCAPSTPSEQAMARNLPGFGNNNHPHYSMRQISFRNLRQMFVAQPTLQSNYLLSNKWRTTKEVVNIKHAMHAAAIPTEKVKARKLMGASTVPSHLVSNGEGGTTAGHGPLRVSQISMEIVTGVCSPKSRNHHHLMCKSTSDFKRHSGLGGGGANDHESTLGKSTRPAVSQKSQSAPRLDLYSPDLHQQRRRKHSLPSVIQLPSDFSAASTANGIVSGSAQKGSITPSIKSRVSAFVGSLSKVSSRSNHSKHSEHSQHSPRFNRQKLMQEDFASVEAFEAHTRAETEPEIDEAINANGKNGNPKAVSRPTMSLDIDQLQSMNEQTIVRSPQYSTSTDRREKKYV